MITNSEKQRRLLANRAERCIGAEVEDGWDWRQGELGPIDLVPFIGGSPFRQIMNLDFRSDSGGYRKIGGTANTPNSAYLYRRYANLLHLLKRQDRLHLRGGIEAESGMVMVLDWPAARGRYNFSPDRLGVVLSTNPQGLRAALPMRLARGWVVSEFNLLWGSPSDRSIIAFADPPI
jgi:hypothetical protein